MFQQPSAIEQAVAQSSFWGSILTLIIAGTSALLGLVAGWLGAYVKVNGENLATKEDFREALLRVEQNTSVIEDIKASVARRSTLDSELREAVRQFTIAAGGLLHSLCWLTWDCTTRNRLDSEMTSRYDTEAHLLLPQIMAQLAVVAMLDRQVHDKLLPLSQDIYSIDAKVGNAVALTETDLERGLQQLRIYHVEGNELDAKFRENISNLLNRDEAKTV